MTLYSEQALRSRASRLINVAPLDWNRSDDDMNERARLIPTGVKPKPSAVLIPIIMRDVPSVLLTTRTAQLKSHAGQIAFPGGKLDANETPLAAALREAQEEVGLDERFVEPIGYLDGYLTITAYMIAPVVALVHEGFTLQPAKEEVDDVFEVPLSFLMDVKNCERHSRDWQGVTRHYNAYPWQDRYIWGATAGIIRNMAERMYG
jgi:8-oxo-dGTP pyrophosphatase MutT (NUDIX family)